jgi:hypothetical protein
MSRERGLALTGEALSAFTPPALASFGHPLPQCKGRGSAAPSALAPVARIASKMTPALSRAAPVTDRGRCFGTWADGRHPSLSLSRAGRLYFRYMQPLNVQGFSEAPCPMRLPALAPIRKPLVAREESICPLYESAEKTDDLRPSNPVRATRTPSRRLDSSLPATPVIQSGRAHDSSGRASSGSMIGTPSLIG